MKDKTLEELNLLYKKNPYPRKRTRLMNSDELHHHYKKMLNRERITQQHVNMLNRAIGIYYYGVGVR